MTLTQRIIDHVDTFGRSWKLTATGIARNLRADPASVSSILRKLVRKNILERRLSKFTWTYFS